jgi:hypothetical protein
MDPLVEVLESREPQTSEADEGSAVTLRAGNRSYDPGRFRQTIYKTGNYLRHCGVHEGAVVELLPAPAPETVFGIFGTWLLGGRVAPVPSEVDGPDAGHPSDDTVAVRLGPTSELPGQPVEPGCTLLGFGAEPADPSVAYFEREIWSENPFFPETDLPLDRPLFARTDGPTPLDRFLDRAGVLAGELDSADTVAIRRPLLRPDTALAGLLAPLLARATILLPADDQVGSVALAEGQAPEPRTISPLDDDRPDTLV